MGFGVVWYVGCTHRMGCMVWGKGWGGTHRWVCVARGCVAREMETVDVR